MPTRFIVQGKSMLPALRPGDILALEAVPAENIQRGNVLVFAQPDKPDWIVHRVVAITAAESGPFFITQGDNIAYRREHVQADWIVGKVVGRYKKQRLVPIRRAEELFWLRGARWVRKSRRVRYFVLCRMMPLLQPLLAARIIPVKHVAVGDKQLAIVCGRVIASKEQTAEGVQSWVHPLFKRTSVLD